jgi:hypothetical protein
MKAVLVATAILALAFSGCSDANKAKAEAEKAKAEAEKAKAELELAKLNAAGGQKAVEQKPNRPADPDRPEKPIGVPQGAAALVGTWRANSTEYGNKFIATWQLRADRTYTFTATSQGIVTNATSGTWTYSGGTVSCTGTQGFSSCTVRWVTNDEFIATILGINADPGSAGVKRHYFRQ